MKTGIVQSWIRARRRGIIWAEVAVCVPIAGLLVALTASGFVRYYRCRTEATARQAAVWAAAAQLQRYQAGAALDSAPPSGLIAPEIALKTTAQPGQGQWEGFQLVTVTATYEIGEKRSIREKISGYVHPEAKP